MEFQKALEADLGNQREMEERLERRKAELLARYNATAHELADFLTIPAYDELSKTE